MLALPAYLVGLECQECLPGLECLECWNAGVCQNAVLWEAAGMNVATCTIQYQDRRPGRKLQKKTNNKKYICAYSYNFNNNSAIINTQKYHLDKYMVVMVLILYSTKHYKIQTHNVANSRGKTN